jgi:hypothetical protein
MKIAHDHKSLMVRKLDKNWTNRTSSEGCRMPQKCPKCLKGSRGNLPGEPSQTRYEWGHKWAKGAIAGAEPMEVKGDRKRIDRT